MTEIIHDSLRSAISDTLKHNPQVDYPEEVLRDEIVQTRSGRNIFNMDAARQLHEAEKQAVNSAVKYELETNMEFADNFRLATNELQIGRHAHRVAEIEEEVHEHNG
jgi:hypothetical protein